MKRRIISLMFAITLILAIVITPVSALVSSSNSTHNCTIADYLEASGISKGIYENAEIYLCTLDVTRSNDAAGITTYDSNLPLPSDEYAIRLLVKNTDGTYTESFVFNVYENSGVLESVIEPIANSRSGFENNYGTALALTDKISVCGTTTQARAYNPTWYGHSFYIDATYSMIDMTQYDSSRRAYHPVSSTFKITENNPAYDLFDFNFITLLHGDAIVNTSDPYDREVDLYDFNRQYETESPISGYTYSFNDYTYYVGAGYSGYHIHICAIGLYTVKTEFTYGSYDYTVRYDIYPYNQSCE